jgi:hypothetical protein
LFLYILDFSRDEKVTGKKSWFAVGMTIKITVWGEDFFPSPPFTPLFVPLPPIFAERKRRRGTKTLPHQLEEGIFLVSFGNGSKTSKGRRTFFSNKHK